MLEQMIELGLEGRIRLGAVISLFEREYERHQRLGDETAAENAEMAALVRAVAERVLLVDLGHATLPARMSPTAASSRRAVAKAARARATKAAILALSFTPGALSTPEETSTPLAPLSAIASATLSGSRPPESRCGLAWPN